MILLSVTGPASTTVQLHEHVQSDIATREAGAALSTFRLLFFKTFPRSFLETVSS